MEPQLGDLQRAGPLTEAVDVILARIARTGALESALEGVDYVQENGPEKLELRQTATLIDKGGRGSFHETNRQSGA